MCLRFAFYTLLHMSSLTLRALRLDKENLAEAVGCAHLVYVSDRRRKITGRFGATFNNEWLLEKTKWMDPHSAPSWQRGSAWWANSR